MTPSTTESDNLDAQQDALSSLLMLHHANTMRIGVEENVNGAVGSGTATANYADQHGFYYSSRNADRADRAKVQGMLGYLDGDDASGIGDPMWNVWIKGRYSYYDGDGNAFDGYVADIFGGIDYKLSSSVVVGALTGYGRTDFDTITSGTAGGFEADGFTIGGYAGIGFGGGVTLNAMLAYTGSQYDNRSGTTTGSFDADRVTVAASLRGRHEMANGWTLVPVLILVGIAVPSIDLLAKQFKPAPDKALTVKVTGNQWFWTYSYPDNGEFEVISYMLNVPGMPEINPGQRMVGSDPSDGPSHLEVDNRLVLPVGEPIRMQITAADVIHSFAVPSLWFKLDAVPGRINEKVLTIDKPGVYYGQCSELCGPKHGFMPIAIEALPRDQFNAWVLKQAGGKIDGQPEPAASPAADAAAPAAAPAADAPAADAAAPATPAE